MTTEKPPLDWSKPLQTTDGVKAELRYTLKGGLYKYNRAVTVGDKDVLFDEDGREVFSTQLINTPETKLVEFVSNVYLDDICSHFSRAEADRRVAPNCIGRIYFSMQLEPGKNYEVTGVKEVQ